MERCLLFFSFLFFFFFAGHTYADYADVISLGKLLLLPSNGLINASPLSHWRDQITFFVPLSLSLKARWCRLSSQRINLMAVQPSRRPQSEQDAGELGGSQKLKRLHIVTIITLPSALYTSSLFLQHFCIFPHQTHQILDKECGGGRDQC